MAAQRSRACLRRSICRFADITATMCFLQSSQATSPFASSRALTFSSALSRWRFSFSAFAALAFASLLLGMGRHARCRNVSPRVIPPGQFAEIPVLVARFLAVRGRWGASEGGAATSRTRPAYSLRPFGQLPFCSPRRSRPLLGMGGALFSSERLPGS